MDLIRTILSELERNGHPLQTVRLEAEGYSPEQVSYHVMLLAQADYIDAINATTFGNLDWRPRSLTWKGHEFLDATRSDGVWHKLKAEIKDRGLTTLPMELIKELAIKIAARAVGLG